jgi:hypothetical protein
MNNCGCCCTNTLNFCDQNICGDIDFDIKAQANGEHTLVTHFLGIQIVIKKSFLDTQEIIFPLEGLNESYEYTVELFDPTGAKIIIRKNAIDYDCFKFKTVLSKSIAA